MYITIAVHVIPFIIMGWQVNVLYLAFASRLVVFIARVVVIMAWVVVIYCDHL